MKIAIVSSSHLPIPATLGGGVETLIETIICENEKSKDFNISVFSIWNKESLIESKKYICSKFIYIHVNSVVDYINKKLYRVMKKKFNVYINPFGVYSIKVIMHLLFNKYDVIVFENNYHVALCITKFIKEKKILHLHNDNFSKFDYGKLSGKFSKIVVVSEYIKNQAISIPKLSSENYSVLLNSTDLYSFNKLNYEERLNLRIKYNIHEDDIVVLFTGRLDPRKGVKELILAFNQIRNKCNIKLLIIGSPEYGKTVQNQYFKELIQISREYSDKIIFTGYINHDKLPSFYNIADIAVVPSILPEAAGLVVLEAMASGLPLIVTNSGGITEYADKTCSIVVELNELLIENITASIEDLVHNDKKRYILGINSKIRAKNFSNEIYFKNFKDIIKSI